MKEYKEVTVKFNKKKIKIKTRKLSFFEMGRGLMFRSRNCDNLLFEFKHRSRYMNALTSHFVFFDFLALWLDDKNKVIEHKIITPFKSTIVSKYDCPKLIEIPFNDVNKNLIEFFVGKRKV